MRRCSPPRGRSRRATLPNARCMTRKRIIPIYAGLIGANVGVWLWAMPLARTHPTLLDGAALAYGLGIRHAFEADHIAVIDNMTRHLNAPMAAARDCRTLLLAPPCDGCSARCARRCSLRHRPRYASGRRSAAWRGAGAAHLIGLAAGACGPEHRGAPRHCEVDPLGGARQRRAARRLDLSGGVQCCRRSHRSTHTATGDPQRFLEAPVHRLVVRIPLRKHVPLGARVENPQHRFQDLTSGDGFAARTTIRNIFLRKVLANPLPILRHYMPLLNDFEIGSSLGPFVKRLRWTQN